jgi:PEP-CTERM motif
MKKLSFVTRRLSCLAMATGLMAGLCGSANASLLWYDGFATPPYVPAASNAVPLNGQSGGTGTFFTGPWAHQSGNDHHVAGYSIPNGVQPMAVGTPINLPIGGAAVGTDTPGGCCDTVRDARIMASPWDGFTDPDGTFYMSFFVNYGVGPTLHHRVLEMWDGDQGNDGNRNLQLGYSEFTGVGSTDGAGHHMGISVHDSLGGGNINQDLIGGPVFASDGKTHLMVLRFDMSTTADDRIRAYLDPIGTIEPGSAAADIDDPFFLIDRMGVVTDFTFGDTQHASAMDEIRIGTTFADVANLQVPEPATLSLLGLGGIGVILAMCRKHA